MNPTHIHLLITHLPVFGTILGAVVLAHGIFLKSYQTKVAAYNVFNISAIGAAIAYLTGEAAEETVENISGIAKNAIEKHEDFAMYALASMLFLGVMSIAGLLLTIKKHVFTANIAVVILLFSLISFGIAARTGYLGGQIRHTEISNTTTTIQNEGNENDDD